MSSLRGIVFGVLTAICGLATAFFTYFGVQLVYAAFTFTGEGSLGHVGMFIAAIVFPLLAVFFAGCTFLAWREMRRPPSAPLT